MSHAHVIDGKAFAETLRGRVAVLAASFEQATGRKAGLAVVLDGRVPHAMLLEIFTSQGAGTLIRAES